MNVKFISGLILMIFVVGMLAGSYPTFYLTSFRPVEVLKGNLTAGIKSRGTRRALVVFQFVLGIFMIIATLVVNNQMSFIKEKNLGFDQSNLLVIDINNGAVRPVFKTMRNEMMQVTGVEGVSVTSRVPGGWARWQCGMGKRVKGKHVKGKCVTGKHVKRN